MHKTRFALLVGSLSLAFPSQTAALLLAITLPVRFAVAIQFSYGYVFSMIPDDKTACFACVFPKDYVRDKHTGAVPVNSLSTSVSGSLGAAEVLKWFLGYKDNMVVNRKHYFNSLVLSGEIESEIIPRNPTCPVCSKHYD